MPIKGDMVLSSALPLRACAAQGLGASLLPDWLIDEDVERGISPIFRRAAVDFIVAPKDGAVVRRSQARRLFA